MHIIKIMLIMVHEQVTFDIIIIIIAVYYES